MVKSKILAVVDDEEVFHWIMEKNIESLPCSCECLSFFTGEEIYQYLLDGAEIVPDVIFLDLNMPITNGWDFLDSYLQVKANLKMEPNIYVVSSSIDPEDKKKALSYPDVKDFISKPVTEAFLAEVICGQ